jgi:hypothetical protein
VQHGSAVNNKTNTKYWSNKSITNILEGDETAHWSCKNKRTMSSSNVSI